MLGTSSSMREIFAVVERTAPTDLTVLITGETGTGKELVARAIHESSGQRAAQPFVVLDCASIPATLIESALFGHERGAFTGADQRRSGHFEQANGGTIFLDEIGELDLSLQPRLLRVLERKEVRRVGASEPISVDARILAATNRDLRAAVQAGTFREDLYYRLSTVLITLPPLRARRHDIPLLAQHFLDVIAHRRGLGLSFLDDAWSHLRSYSWPGNVRELRNVVERAAELAVESTIGVEDLRLSAPRALIGTGLTPTTTSSVPAEVTLPEVAVGLEMHFKQAKQCIVEAFEAAYLRALLAHHKGNITHAARGAGLTRHHLRDLIRRYQAAGA
jgi:transcriptional regulator with GAF, ATPase, and Fis domain